MLLLRRLLPVAVGAWSFVCADDATPPDGIVVDDDDGTQADQAEPSQDDAASSPEASQEEQLKDYASMSQDLLDKLNQLKTLIKKKGDKVSPEELEKIKSLEKMLSGMGLSTKAATPQDKEVEEFFSACILMSMRRAGAQRASTQSGLSMMAQGKVTREIAATSDLWKNTVACITRLSDAELAQFKAKSLTTLPKVHEQFAQSPEIKDEIMKLPDEYFDYMQRVSKSLVGDAPKSTETPAYLGFAALGLIVVVVVFATRRLLDMDKARKEKAGKKKDKKQK